MEGHRIRLPSPSAARRIVSVAERCRRALPVSSTVADGDAQYRSKRAGASESLPVAASASALTPLTCSLAIVSPAAYPLALPSAKLSSARSVSVAAAACSSKVVNGPRWLAATSSSTRNAVPRCAATAAISAAAATAASPASPATADSSAAARRGAAPRGGTAEAIARESSKMSAGGRWTQNPSKSSYGSSRTSMRAAAATGVELDETRQSSLRRRARRVGRGVEGSSERAVCAFSWAIPRCTCVESRASHSEDSDEVAEMCRSNRSCAASTSSAARPQRTPQRRAGVQSSGGPIALRSSLPKLRRTPAAPEAYGRTCSSGGRAAPPPPPSGSTSRVSSRAEISRPYALRPRRGSSRAPSSCNATDAAALPATSPSAASTASVASSAAVAPAGSASVMRTGPSKRTAQREISAMRMAEPSVSFLATDTRCAASPLVPAQPQ